MGRFKEIGDGLFNFQSIMCHYVKIRGMFQSITGGVYMAPRYKEGYI